MLAAVIKGRQINVVDDNVITSGSVGIPIEFTFSSEWSELTKVAVFIGSGRKISVILESNTCNIPHETLTDPGTELEIGVYGINQNGTIIIPTIWCRPISVQEGTSFSGDSGTDPTPTILNQFFTKTQQAIDTADNAMELSEETAETVDNAMNWLYEHGMPSGDNPLVDTFNGRNGAVVLLKDDIEALFNASGAARLEAPAENVYDSAQGASQADINAALLSVNGIGVTQVYIADGYKVKLTFQNGTAAVVFCNGKESQGNRIVHIFTTTTDNTPRRTCNPSLSDTSKFNVTTNSSLQVIFSNNSGGGCRLIALAFDANKMPVFGNAYT